MVVDFTARVKHGRLRIEVPQARLDVDIPDIVACDRSTQRIVALGQSEDEVRHESPERWERDKGRIEFRTAFDTRNFDAVLAVSVLSHYAGKAQSRIRPGLLVRAIGRLVDRFNYDLRLPGYEDVPAKTRAKFVGMLRTFPCVYRFSINGKRVLGR
jgi:hypothetical protein